MTELQGQHLSYGLITTRLAEQTGFNENTLMLFWDALKTMYYYILSKSSGLL